MPFFLDIVVLEEFDDRFCHCKSHKKSWLATTNDKKYC